MRKRKRKNFQAKVILIVITGALILFVLIKGVGVLLEQTLLIEREQVVLRLEPDTSAEAIEELWKGSQVRILEERNGWLRIRSKQDQEGWLPEWLLKDEFLANDQEVAAQLLITTPVYGERNESSQVLRMIEPGTYVLVDQEIEGWLTIRTGLETSDGQIEEEQVGYIPTRLVNLVSKGRAVTYIDEHQYQTLLAYDPEAIAQARLAVDPEVIIQFNDEPLMEADDVYSEIVYRASLGESFSFVGDLKTDLKEDFYLVENAEGQRGYVDSDRVSVSTYSIGRLEKSPANELAQTTIMLDPGHGGVDTGALSWDGSREEKVATFDLVVEIKKQLEAKGATVLMTRSGDDYFELVDRTKASNINEVDLFVSLHFDDSENADWSGTNTYYYHETDKPLAQAVNQELDSLELENFGMMCGNYHVLRENTRPSILLELGYMSNYYDVETIFDRGYQKDVASSITRGLENYLKAN